VISNQSGVAADIFPESLVAPFTEINDRATRQRRTHIDALYYCPHKGDDACACRKPKPAMLERAARDTPGFTPPFVVGDRYGRYPVWLIVSSARHHGAYRVRGRRNSVAFRNLPAPPEFIAADLADAADWILRQQK